MRYEEYEIMEIENLKKMLKAGTSAALTVEAAARQLAEAGFQELDFLETWEIKKGGRYFLRHHWTTILAFTVGTDVGGKDDFRIAAAHTDYPCLRVKPNPDLAPNGYRQLNVEVYGSPILNTWLDRPLGLSGRVAVKSETVMRPEVRLLNITRPIGVIPNLAIHLNREMNKGVELNRQTDLLPLVGTGKGEQEDAKAFVKFLSEYLEVKTEDILDYELWLSCLQEPVEAGLESEFLLSPRLDNLTSVQALVSGVISGMREQGVNLIALFDHEEVGSRSKQGAGSLLLLHVLEKIGACLGKSEMDTRACIYRSMLLSADVAQGSHPNYMGKADLTNRPVLNKGLCIKEACSQSYATDCEAVAVVEQLCQKHGIAYQKYVNRSDVAGGGTVGSIVSRIVPVPTVDIGVPLLAMHSAVETMGTADQREITRLITSFFEE